jgi:hypothetical protein
MSNIPQTTGGQAAKRPRQDSDLDTSALQRQLQDHMNAVAEENKLLRKDNQELRKQLTDIVKQLGELQTLLLSGKVQPAPQQPPPPSQAATTAATATTTAPPQQQAPPAQQEWKTVSQKGKQSYAQRAAKPAAPTAQKATKTANNTPPVITKNDRRILIPRNPKNAPRSNTLEVRNTVNKSLARCNAPARVVVTSATYNSVGTLILTTREDCTNGDVLKHKDEIFKDLKKIDSAIQAPKKDEKWAKVIVHGVPTGAVDDGAAGMNDLKQEIEQMNPSIKLVTTPRWLTKPEQRKDKGFSSVVIAVQSHKEAEPILKKSLWLFNRQLKTARYLAVKPTDQCGKCQGFGHHAIRCVEAAKCQICAAKHETRLHVCNTCQKRGKPCSHGELKCANCGEKHKANDPTCEVIKQARKAPPTAQSAPIKKILIGTDAMDQTAA